VRRAWIYFKDFWYFWRGEFNGKLSVHLAQGLQVSLLLHPEEGTIVSALADSYRNVYRHGTAPATVRGYITENWTALGSLYAGRVRRRLFQQGGSTSLLGLLLSVDQVSMSTEALRSRF
jgi:hypothetical protein